MQPDTLYLTPTRNDLRVAKGRRKSRSNRTLLKSTTDENILKKQTNRLVIIALIIFVISTCTLFYLFEN